MSNNTIKKLLTDYKDALLNSDDNIAQIIEKEILRLYDERKNYISVDLEDGNELVADINLEPYDKEINIFVKNTKGFNQYIARINPKEVWNSRRNGFIGYDCRGIDLKVYSDSEIDDFTTEYIIGVLDEDIERY